MAIRGNYREYLGLPEKEIELILYLEEVFGAIKSKFDAGKLDLTKVDQDIPDPYELNLPVIELLEVYLQDAITNVDILKESGDLKKIGASTKARFNLIREAEELLVQFNQMVKQKEKGPVKTGKVEFQEKLTTREKFNRLPLHGESLNFVSLLLESNGATIKEGLLKGLEDIYEANKSIESFDPRDFDGINLVVGLEEILIGLNTIEASFPETDPSDKPDPIAYKKQIKLFNNELIHRAAELIVKFEEVVERLDVKAEIVRVEKKDQTRIQETLEIAELLQINGDPELVEDDRNTLNLANPHLLEVRQNIEYKNAQQDKIGEGLNRYATNSEKVQVLRNTIKALDADLNPQQEELNELFALLKKKLESKLRTKLDDASFSPEMFILLRDQFAGEPEIIKKINRAKTLIAIIRKKTVLFANLNIVLERIDLARADEKTPKTEAEKNKEEIVEAIYNNLRTSAVPANKEYSLPEFEKFFERPSAEAYDSLSTVIIRRFEKFYNDELSGGSTVFAYHKGSVNLWSNEHMFSVPLEGAEELGTFQYFIENFPWERFLPEEKRTSENIIDFRQKMIDLWKYRILHIQNSSNAASGIENLWRGNEHGNYYKEVFNHIASRGDGGGLQAWDLGPYYNYNHSGQSNGDVLYREAFGGPVEESWLISEYENYLIFRIQQDYSKLQLNDLEGLVDKLSNDLKPGQIGGRNTILQDLYDLIEDRFDEKRLKKDKEKIGLAVQKAIWNLTYTLKLHEFDKGGIHTKLGRLMNIKAYYSKVFGTGVSGVKWRGTIGVCVERALPPTESFQTLDLLLTDPTTNQPIYDRLDMASMYQEVLGGKLPPMYAKWLLNLKLQATDAITDITTNAHVSELKKTRKELLEKTSIQNDSQLSSAKSRAKTLQERINNDTNYAQDEDGLLTESGKAAQQKDVVDLNKLIAAIDKYETAKYIGKLLKFLADNNAVENPPIGEEARSINRAAALFAITERYDVLYIKPKYTGVGTDVILPIAVPKQRLIKNPDGSEIARGVPVQMIRDSQIATQFVDLSALTAKPNTALNGHVGEAMKLVDAVDLTDHDAVFTPIHAKDPQDKIRAIESVFYEKDALQNMLLKAKINLGEITSRQGAAIENGKKLDEYLRSKIYIVDIPLHEIVSDSEKPGEKPPGLGFIKWIQYAGKYLWGKTLNKMLFLEMFREYHNRLEDIVVEGRGKNADIQQSWFLEKTVTPVADFVRNCVDQHLENPKSGRAESEFIAGIFWLAVAAYLDQYSYDKEVGKNMAIPLTKDQRENEIETIETLSGVKPMDFADRQLFLAYVERTLKFFSEFWTGAKAPRNIGTVGNVIEMMEARGIIGSKQQIFVDLHAYESGRYASLVRKSASKK